MVCYGRSGNEGLDAEHNRAAHDRYHAIVRQIWDTVPSADVVTLSEGAQEVRNRITQAAYKLIETKFLSSGFCSAVGKYTGLSARLMLTYHTIECAAKSITCFVDNTLDDFPGYANVRRVLLLTEPWSVDNGLLTPTLKLMRPKVYARFAQEIEAFYERH